MSGQRRSTALCGRLLLFTALLFGIVAMHSFGHPAEHCASRVSGDADMSGNTAMSVSVTATAVRMPMHHTAESAAEARRAEHPKPVGGMDPSSVCLAVLGAGVLALLLGAAFTHRPTDVPAAVLAQLPHALRPIPPPRRGTLLAQLSVLRV
ncbi:DUF6153 family protein [Streptomyces natalensis]|uniref:Uncharacterized protein n=1 Tax=Streptomyces natalensis ATCC 27448 TaxID=1240678 RepID=A0A0D7CGY8_9ACTN|nr:DUF6153 family protein [Streptomyces natalensis]KIZ15291.1 hypothetical protein SNA_27295 [Streptomyces natalensis ATCC 27448]